MLRKIAIRFLFLYAETKQFIGELIGQSEQYEQGNNKIIIQCFLQFTCKINNSNNNTLCCASENAHGSGVIVYTKQRNAAVYFVPFVHCYVCSLNCSRISTFWSMGRSSNYELQEMYYACRTTVTSRKDLKYVVFLAKRCSF